MKRIVVAQSAAEAYLVAGLLEEAGIQAVVEGEFLTGARFDLPTDASTLPSVAVRDEDVDRAQAVLREHAARRTHPSSDDASPEPPVVAEDGAPELPADEDPVARRPPAWFRDLLLVWFVILPAVVVLVLLLALLT